MVRLNSDKGEIVKTCNIHGNLTKSEVYKIKVDDKYIISQCKRCKNAPKRGEAKVRQIILCKEWKKKNKDLIKEYNRNHQKNLTDYYVKNQLSKQLKIDSSKIPPELIEIKRSMIQLKRLINERRRNGIS